MNDRIPDPYAGEGLNEAVAADLEKDELSGTGGSSGGGARQGKGDVSGGTTDREPSVPAGTAHGAAAEAAALGRPDEGLAAMGQRSNAGAEPTGAEPTGAEALGAGPGRGGAGSGTSPDTGDVGGGGTRPVGTATSGARSRKDGENGE